MSQAHKMRAGINPTGIKAKPQQTKELLSSVAEFPPNPPTPMEHLAAYRVDIYSTETTPPVIPFYADTSLPHERLVLIDKIGARLAFERGGTRLYETLLTKHEAKGSYDGGPSYSDLVAIRNQELVHFEMLTEVMDKLGSDPTAITPAANVQDMASHGIRAVVTNPITTLVQSLEALLIAELADNEEWSNLIKLAQHAGESQLVQRFERAKAIEEEHLRKARAWVTAGYGLPTPVEPKGK